MVQKLRFIRLRKRGAEIVRSLLSEGYMLEYQSNGCEVASLRHRSNGNRMQVKVGQLGVFVYKNGSLCKLEVL